MSFSDPHPANFPFAFWSVKLPVGDGGFCSGAGMPRMSLRRFCRGCIAGGLLMMGAVGARAADDPVAAAPTVATRPPGSNRVYEAELSDFTGAVYGRAVEALLARFEADSGRRLVPGEHHRAGLKVYSDSGAGLATPLGLVRALIQALEHRGFTRDALCIVGLSGNRLREAGFLPPLSVGGSTFDGVPVFVLESGKYYDPAWFYDSPLPAARVSLSREDDLGDVAGSALSDAERRSLLPVPLMFDVDFWINLPSCSDHPILGVNGALVNATLWNASNTLRFFRSPANGPAAAAEIAAIPELRATWACTIISLEHYQFIGGPVFNSLYTLSEPRVWLSDNPVMIDALLRQRINAGRAEAGFRGLPSDLRLLAYGEQVGLGSGQYLLAEMVPVRVDATGP